MDTPRNEKPQTENRESPLSDSELDRATGGIIIIGGAESRFCSNNLTTALPTDQFRQF